MPQRKPHTSDEGIDTFDKVPADINKVISDETLLNPKLFEEELNKTREVFLEKIKTILNYTENKDVSPYFSAAIKGYDRSVEKAVSDYCN